MSAKPEYYFKTTRSRGFVGLKTSIFSSKHMVFSLGGVAEYEENSTIHTESNYKALPLAMVFKWSWNIMYMSRVHCTSDLA